MKPRVFIYSAIIILLTTVLSLKIYNREAIQVAIIRAIERPYQELTLDDGRVQIINHFRVHLKNQAQDPLNVSLVLSEELKALGVEVVAPMYPIDLEFGADKKHHIFVKFPKESLSEIKASTSSIEFIVKSKNIDKQIKKEVSLVGPLS